jgi:hypothetical protein
MPINRAKIQTESLPKAHTLSPAMAAGITDKFLSMSDLAEMVDAAHPKSGKRGPYKKRAA